MVFKGLTFAQWLETLQIQIDRHYGRRPAVKLTENFLDTELGVAGLDPRIVGNATYLCSELLEPIRLHFHQPIHVHDGYRDPQHNARVGGKPNSWHLYEGGHAAADINVMGVDLTEAFDWITLSSGLPFDKVILEAKNGRPATIHLQIDCLVAPRRLAYTGGTGDSQDYTQVTVG